MNGCVSICALSDARCHPHGWRPPGNPPVGSRSAAHSARPHVRVVLLAALPHECTEYAHAKRVRVTVRLCGQREGVCVCVLGGGEDLGNACAVTWGVDALLRKWSTVMARFHNTLSAPRAAPLGLRVPHPNESLSHNPGARACPPALRTAPYVAPRSLRHMRKSSLARQSCNAPRICVHTAVNASLSWELITCVGMMRAPLVQHAQYWSQVFCVGAAPASAPLRSEGHTRRGCHGGVQDPRQVHWH